MGTELESRTAGPLTSRRSLVALRHPRNSATPIPLNVVKECLTGFVQRLQERYPFRFITAYRNLDSELHKQVQERLVTKFLFGAIGELSELTGPTKDKLWQLGAMLSQSIGKGGENFFPREFTPEERALAQEIGDDSFRSLLAHAEQLSLALKFKIGPVNSAEHTISWCFRYVAQLLKAARWEARKS